MVPGFKSSFNNYTKRHPKRNDRQLEHPNPNQKRDIDYSEEDDMDDTEYVDNDRQLEHLNPNPYPNPSQNRNTDYSDEDYMDNIPQAMGQWAWGQNFQNRDVDYFERPEQYRRQNYSNNSTRGFSQVKGSWNYRT
ncbi:unnamed protein product [Rhizophagus irregularis]|uniref:Uncharacterized protein n=1 Tax=Rhizophagus irregularis TaxID=588596 RepID=A0A915Z1Q4_9GLOM|nr:unnamed protein product [Rhizophagus irregularis]CAB5182281.1 unnamed protein product [Rhizophagus irregularis]CAB5359078.1 unnamed protein product [Rhizophagus irregularis]